MRTLRLNDTEYAFCDELGMETVDVRELKLQGCMGCGACERRIHHGGECAVADDMQMLYPKIAQCEKLASYAGRALGAAVRSASAFWIVWRCLAIRNIP